MQSQPPPKGSLEELFRHHLLESEAAAVPPRPLVWEHIDNSLLLAQNEKYRRRLLVHRWGMAASLLLATLAGGGWWHSQQAATATLAANTTAAQREAARQAVAGAVRPISAANPNATTLAANSTSVRRETSAVAAGTTAAGRAADDQATAPAAASGSVAYEGTGRRAKTGQSAKAGLLEHAARSGSATTLAYGTTARPAHGAHQATGAASTRPSTLSSPNAYAIAGTSTSPFAGASDALSATSQPGASAAEQLAPISADNALAATSTTRGLGEEMLSARLVSLALAAPSGLPTNLVTKPLPPLPTQLRHWRYGAEYAVSAFQPNIDFNRGSSDYSPALGTNTISLTRAAAAEYRANLRPGLGQRLTLRATRWLGGHWSLGTGLEVTQQTAYSATSAAFTGEQLVDLSSFNSSLPSTSPNYSYASRDLRESSFRYRSAGIPIELQYDNQAKNGVSFYGRIGAIVSALLSAHSEVAGNAEATRSYTAFSASSPYRRLTALLRGSAGVRYRPAGRGWGLNVGPTAEAGVQSLNAETDRSFLQQQRPYSVGIEAGLEFGGGLKPVPATN